MILERKEKRFPSLSVLMFHANLNEQKRIPVVDAFSTIIPTLKYKVYVPCILHALLGELVEYKNR